MTRLINEIWSCKTYVNMQQLMSILRKIRCNIAMKASSLGSRVTERSLQSLSINWHSCNDPIISSSLCWGLAHYKHWLKGHIFVHKERVPWHYLCSAERKVEEDHQEEKCREQVGAKTEKFTCTWSHWAICYTKKRKNGKYLPQTFRSIES